MDMDTQFLSNVCNKNVMELHIDSLIWDIFTSIALLVVTFSLVPKIYCDTRFLSQALRNFKCAMSECPQKLSRVLGLQ